MYFFVVYSREREKKKYFCFLYKGIGYARVPALEYRSMGPHGQTKQDEGTSEPNPKEPRGNQF